MKKAFAALLVAVIILAASSAWAGGGTIKQMGYSVDKVTWTFFNVVVPTSGYVGVTMPDGSVFYVLAPGYNGPLPTGEFDTLCWCSIENGNQYDGACKCGNECSDNGHQGHCTIPYSAGGN
jgi:hypothetical protein